jgi:serine/threonine protein kinase
MRRREVKNLKFLNSKDPDCKHVYKNIENFKHQGRHCIVLDFYQGTTIKQEITASRKQGLPVSVIRRTVAQLLDTFAFLHSHDVIHGDLKPDNAVLVGGIKGSTVKLIDFGLSYRTANMQKNMYIQSRWYRSPEVLVGIPATPMIDIWTVGCLCTEMFLGFAPFRGYDSFDQMQRIAEILCLPNDRMRGECEAATIVKLNELDQAVAKKRQAKGQTPTKLSDAEAAVIFIDKLITHRKTQKTDNDSECRQLAELCSMLLQVDPKNRPTAAEALLHPFLRVETKDEMADVSTLDTSTNSKNNMSLDSLDTSIDGLTRTLSGGEFDRLKSSASPNRVAGFGSRTASPSRSPPRVPRGLPAIAGAAPAAGPAETEASRKTNRPAPAMPATTSNTDAISVPKTGFQFRPAQSMRRMIGRCRSAGNANAAPPTK